MYFNKLLKKKISLGVRDLHFLGTVMEITKCIVKDYMKSDSIIIPESVIGKKAEG